MVDKYHLSAAEKEIMEKLWAQGAPIRQVKLLQEFNEEGKDWQRQTLNTLLIRLEKRGLIQREKRMVRAYYSRQEFGRQIILEAMKEYLPEELEKIQK